MRFLIAAVAAALLASSVGCQATRCGSACGNGCAACPEPCCGCEECGPSCGCGPSCSEGCGCGQGGCGNGRCGLFDRAGGSPSTCPLGPGDSAYDFTPGPAGAQVAYPYYTTKGPRDFLMKNPPPLGPNGAYGCR